jgi:hypothetical protein
MGNHQSSSTANTTHHPDALRLLSAATARDVETAHLLLKQSVTHLHARGEHHRTPILLCCALGSKAVLYDAASRSQFLGFLLSRGARVSDRDDLGWTPLHHCCAVGDLEGVRLLIENGADPDVTNNQGISAIEFLHRDYVVPGRNVLPGYTKDMTVMHTIKQTRSQVEQPQQQRQHQETRASTIARATKEIRHPPVSNATGFDEEAAAFNEDIDDLEEFQDDGFNEVLLDVQVEQVDPVEDHAKNEDTSATTSSNTVNHEHWKLEYCSLRCPDVVKKGEPLHVEYTRGGDHDDQSFVQLYYVVDHKPWALRKRIGDYKSFPMDRQSGTMAFSTKRLSANGRFRFLYHSGGAGATHSSEGGEGTSGRRPERHPVLCASNMIKIAGSGVSGRSLVAAALDAGRATTTTSSSSCGFDEDEFAMHLDQDRSWALPASVPTGPNRASTTVAEQSKQSEQQSVQYQSELLDLTINERIWIDGLRNPPPTEYTIDLIMSTVDIALAMEDDERLVGIRFRLVPCWLTEVEFWRIYFYHVTQIRTTYLPAAVVE